MFQYSFILASCLGARFFFHLSHPPPKPCEQKWSKAKSRDANANKVQFEEELYTRFMAEVPKVRLL